QENELAELSRKLDRARVVASRAGVITYVNKNIGASVNEGDVLVRIADLNSFKVQGSLSDNFLDQVHVGLPAIVNINDVSLRGTISNIQPTVQNGVILFDVQLEEKRHKSLRPNMKVEVFLVTASHNGVLRVANGPAFKGAKSQELFVVSGNKAIRKTVPTGLSSFDFIELNGPVKEGDQVIISDMSEFNHMDEITLTDNKP
nr:HlyD family efflux transporter periplasmic adaptor subunit [Catalimonadaceae bacterium]